ncbi:hypothetical protein MA16_Dca001862 [Dendrobium catenatum]|uniref:Uncharacterized protein n=1 Tax=Dendrobium catenatum TaxID=906689 RepID=A0A2I0XDN6_9ASPA|nr:hypothetical protein MA16_Dca001862 [Dendrobium catenatum]
MVQQQEGEIHTRAELNGTVKTRRNCIRKKLTVFLYSTRLKSKKLRRRFILTRAEEDSSRKERETSLHDALGSLFDFIRPTTPPVAGILAPELAYRQLAFSPAIRPYNRFFWLPPCTTKPNQTPHAVGFLHSIYNSNLPGHRLSDHQLHPASKSPSRLGSPTLSHAAMPRGEGQSFRC